jgi:peptidoglycan hydrolase-like protein with peptidoglycan-binding domain
MNRRGRVAVAAGSAGLVAAVVAGAAIGLGGSGGGQAGASTEALPTRSVEKTTLSQSELVSGSIEYGDPVSVRGHGGVLTWLPALGAVVRRGQPVYRVDNRPVPLFFGRMPLYRSLHAGNTGADVRQVETNLKALGYTGFSVDSRYTAATASAVRKWQKAVKLTRTGVFDPNSVVLARGPIRVAAHTGHLGEAAEGSVLSYTGTVRRVRVDLDVALQDIVRPGVKATITMPDRKTLEGTVTSVGAVTTQGQEPDQPATIAVTVAPESQSALGRLVGAHVSVELTSQEAENVLAVPVVALVALAEGGYGVQLANGSYVAVELGMYADGKVQIAGDGLTEGTPVVVPT